MDGDPRGPTRLRDRTRSAGRLPRTRICMCSPARRAELRGLRMQMYNRITFMLVEPDGQVAVCKIV